MADVAAQALCAGYEQAVLAGGLEARRAPPLEALFARLGGKARLPDAVDHVHVEVFVGGELSGNFPAMIFFMEGNNENFEAVKLLTEMQDGISAVGEVLSYEDADRFMVWEDAEDGGRVVALEQPTDGLQVERTLVMPFLADCIRNAVPARFEKPVHIGLHDDIAAPLRAFVPHKPTLWQKLTGR